MDRRTSYGRMGNGMSKPRRPQPPAKQPTDAFEATPDSSAAAAAMSDSGDYVSPYEEFLGGDATVAPRQFGPSITSNLPDPKSISGEIRKIERRMRSHLTPVFPLEPRRRIPYAYLWKRFRQYAMRGRSEIVDDFGRDPIYSARVAPMLDFLYQRYFRVQATGLENIPTTGRALVVANHSGALPYDATMLMQAVRREHSAHRDLRPMIEDYVFHFPYLGTFLSRIGAVRACQENASRLLDTDHLVAVFPEGAKGASKLYKNRYRLQRFGRGGFVKLALRANAPIVPTAIIGAEEVTPMVAKLTWFAKSVGVPFVPVTPTFPLLGPIGLAPMPTKWFIHFGAPIDLIKEHGAATATDRLAITHIGESIRHRIQNMIDQQVSTRRSILRG